MDRGWTCTCGRRNFSESYPCMLCGALSPSQVADAEARAAAELAALDAPPPPAVRRFSKRDRVVVMIVLLVTVSFVVGYGVTNRARRTGTTAASQLQANELHSGPTTTSTTPAPALDDSLVPPSRDFEDFSPPDFPVGPLVIDQISDRAEHQLLAANHFGRGVAEAWRRPASGDVVMKMALEFATEADAQSYLTKETDGFGVLGGTIVPGAVTGQETFVAGGTRATLQEVVFRKGSRVYSIFVGSPTAKFTAASPAALADEQYRAV